MTTKVSAKKVSADEIPIPAEVGELTAEWFSQVLDCRVSAVEIVGVVDRRRILI